MGRSLGLQYLRNIRVLIVLLIVGAFLATASFAVMSDNSVYGLTTRIFYAYRYCSTNPATTAKTVTFYVVASVWSSSSLHTSISQVAFALSVDGVSVASLNEIGASWDPGKGTSYQLTFASPVLNPLSLPATSTLAISLTAQVSAGIASALVTTSDTSQQNFGNTSC